MEKLFKTGCAFFAIGVSLIGIQQFIYSDFRPVILPAWPLWLHGWNIWAYLAGAGLVIAGICILFRMKPITTALLLGGFFFACCLVFQTPYQLFVSLYSPIHLGLWINTLKELAFSGGSLVVAGALWKELRDPEKPDSPVPNGLILIGRIFFSIMLIAFGLSHFYYPVSVSGLVPSWIPGHLFWTYFAGVALMGSGVCILFGIKLRLVAFLTGLMIFLWFLVLHIPRAIALPNLDQGNEITSVLEALAFSGIAFMIGVKTPREIHPDRQNSQAREKTAQLA